MMRIDRLLYGMLVAMVCFSSCYDDKGNYDYQDMDGNKVSFRFKAYSVTPFYGEPAIMTPIITYYNENVDTNIYKFAYTFEKYGTVCTDRDMNHVFEGATDWLDGVFTITDTTTGMTWRTSISVNYQSPYGKGWFILSDENGNSRINLVRVKNGEYITDQDLYSTLYDDALGIQPYRILLNKNGIASGEAQELRVLQYGPEGSVTLNLKNLQKVKTLASEFVGEEIPNGFKPVDMGFSTHTGVVVGQNGEMYTRTYDNYKLNYNPFVDVPMQYNNRKLDVQYVLVNQPVQNMDNILIYDRATSRFMQIYAAAYYYAGVPSVLVAPASPPVNVPTPDRLDGYQNLYTRLYNGSYYKAGVFSLLKDQTGKVFVYTFSYDTGSDECTNLAIKDFTASSLLSVNTKLHRLRTRPYLFIGVGKELYYYDLNTNVLYPYKKDFTGNITCIESDYTSKDVIVGVGLDNGEFHLLDVSEDAFTSDSKPAPLYSTKLSGKVVDFVCK